MSTPANRVPILMFHSISNAEGPTSIAPGTFRTQMAMIAEHGWTIVPLSDVQMWHAGRIELPNKAMAITFDDGFEDFERHAHPILEKHKFRSTMFVPTSLAGEEENWIGANDPARQIMAWADIRKLDSSYVDFAPHSRSHTDLTTLSELSCMDEVAGSKHEMETELGRHVEHFAAPYGRSNRTVSKAISKHYTLAVGVEHGIATRECDVFDLPRLEMFYYQNPKHWGDFLSGKGGAYLATRQALRKVRKAIKPGTSTAKRSET